MIICRVLHASFTPSIEYSSMEGLFMMKKGFCAAAILSFALVGVVNAQGAISSAENGDHYTKSQLKQLERDAHTPGQYAALAQYYGEQQKNYAQQAAEEKQEWARRSQITASLYAKYPKPADSARNLYEYYALKASEAAALSARYGQMADSSAGSTQQHM
jgi:hypothetical protein